MNDPLKTRRLAAASVVGAAYAVLTVVLAPFSYGNIQCRVSEALCILPWFFPRPHGACSSGAFWPI